MTVLAAHPARLADGRGAIVVTWAAPGQDERGAAATAGLACDREALRQAVAARGAEVAVLCAADADVPALLRRATACDAGRPLLATPRPVTDTVKRIDGAALVATLDRSTLTWAVPPAVVHLPTLRPWLAASTSDVVRPLSGTWARLAWL